MSYSFTEKKRIRKNFRRLEEPLELPNLLALQLESYKEFLQRDIKADKREIKGLQAAFQHVLPIQSQNGFAVLDFLEYELRDAPFSVQECIDRGISYSAPLHVKLRLQHYDREKKDRTVKEAIDQWVFIGDIPLMTENGTFIINGTERVIVSQLHRSPGVYFVHDAGKSYANRLVYSARVIPEIGSWLDFEIGFDSKEQKDRKRDEEEAKARRLHQEEVQARRAQQLEFVTAMHEMLETEDANVGDETSIYDTITFELVGNTNFVVCDDPTHLLGEEVQKDILDANGRRIVKAGDQIVQRHLNRLGRLEDLRIEVSDDFLLGRLLAEDVVDENTGEIVAHKFVQENIEDGLPKRPTALDQGLLQKFRSHAITQLRMLHIVPELVREEIRKTQVSQESFDAALQRYEEALAEYDFSSKGKTKTGKSAEKKEFVFARIDRKNKFHVTHMLRALEMTDQEILDEFFDTDKFSIRYQTRGKEVREKIELELYPERLLGETAKIELKVKGKVICQEGFRVNTDMVAALEEAGLKSIEVPSSYLEGSIVAKTIFNPETDEVICHCNEVLTDTRIRKLIRAGIETIETLYINELQHGSFIADTLRRDPDTEPRNTPLHSKAEIHSVLKPGEPITMDSAKVVFDNTFFSPERFKLSDVGRMKFNHRLGWEPGLTLRHMQLREAVPNPDPRTKDPLFTEGTKLNENRITKLQAEGIQSVETVCDISKIDPDLYLRGHVLSQTIADADGNIYGQKGDALYGALIKRLISVGLKKVNSTLLINDPSVDPNLLDKYDIIGVLKKLFCVLHGSDDIDDIDSLSNRRIRAVGEQVTNAFKNGLRRVDRAVKDRLGQAMADGLMPQDLINAKPIDAAVKEFFGSYELSHFMDQINPLSEVTHKRKISAMGPGGLQREYAGFEVRDVHSSHYGRVCPIETPEGANIGLINSFTIHARTNEYGFIECPVRQVKNGVVTDKVIFLSTMDEDDAPIAQASAALTSADKNGHATFVDERVDVRVKGEFMNVPRERVEYMEVSPKQIVSISAALIPFLEHDEANRGLMGCSQQRQAIPTIKVEAPLVGTGIEHYVAKDSGVCITALRHGTVELVDAGRIVVRATSVAKGEDEIDIYDLVKFKRSNQDTCINHRAIVKQGDHVQRGDVLADGPSVALGELALGQNVRIAFMVWNGFNYEDSILVSERVVQEDRFTSVHILEETCKARETKMGNEEITADIPNVGDSRRRHLDSFGIVRVGAEVEEGDILVGKVTPKGDAQLTPEEKLLRAIFGEKASDVKDTSLRVPSGVKGTVVDVKVLRREDVPKDERALELDEQVLAEIESDLDEQYNILRNAKFAVMKRRLIGTELVSGAGLEPGVTIDAKLLNSIDDDSWFTLRVKDDEVNRFVDRVNEDLQSLKDKNDRELEDRKRKLDRGDDLEPGVLKSVRVFLATKKRIEAGDKMAGRHGNKGVISVIMPVEDMPYDEQGDPIDIVLNPLGVPSRMNIGQVLETHLGWASKELGREIGRLIDHQATVETIRKRLDEIYNHKALGGQPVDLDSLKDNELLELAGNVRNGIPITSPIFDGATEGDVKAMLQMAGLPEDGQTTLYDGRTGEQFDRKITVGDMYMLKLNHLVTDKMHARSTGAYSMVTQQPLGGKARLGGQRFGEMEVWALEAYGAAYTLQEMLTVKSDDVEGRTTMYRRLVDGQYRMHANVPESFNVIRKEIRSLGLNIDLANVG